METLENVNQKNKGINKVMIGAIAVGFLIIAGAIYLLSFQPTLEEQKAKMLEGSLVPGDPAFEKLTRDILFTTDADNTTESPTGLGRIMMTVPATIANKSDKTVTLLQVKLVVVNSKNEVVKEKDAIVVPGLQAKILPPNDSIKIIQTIDGFEPGADRAMVRWTVTAIKTQ